MRPRVEHSVLRLALPGATASVAGPYHSYAVRPKGDREYAAILGGRRRLIERRDALLGECRALISAAQRVGRDYLTAEEDRRYDAAFAEVRKLNTRIVDEAPASAAARAAELAHAEAELWRVEQQVREQREATSKPFRYSYVSAHAVPAGGRALASRAAFEAAHDLKLEPTPDIQWYVQTPEGRTPDFGGQSLHLGRADHYDPPRIQFLWPQDARSIIETAGHEVAHAYGYSEPMADRYGRDFLERYASLARSAA